MTKLRYGCAGMEVDKIFKLPQGSLKLDEILTIRHKFLYFNVTYLFTYSLILHLMSNSPSQLGEDRNVSPKVGRSKCIWE